MQHLGLFIKRNVGQIAFVVAGLTAYSAAAKTETPKDQLISGMLEAGYAKGIENLTLIAIQNYIISLKPGTALNGVDISTPEFKTAVQEDFVKETPKLKEKVSRTASEYYRQRFTENELKTLLEFAKTSAGKKVITDIGRLPPTLWRFIGETSDHYGEILSQRVAEFKTRQPAKKASSGRK